MIITIVDKSGVDLCANLRSSLSHSAHHWISKSPSLCHNPHPLLLLPLILPHERRPVLSTAIYLHHIQIVVYVAGDHHAPKNMTPQQEQHHRPPPLFFQLARHGKAKAPFSCYLCIVAGGSVSVSGPRKWRRALVITLIKTRRGIKFLQLIVIRVGRNPQVQCDLLLDMDARSTLAMRFIILSLNSGDNSFSRATTLIPLQLSNGRATRMTIARNEKGHFGGSLSSNLHSTSVSALGWFLRCDAMRFRENILEMSILTTCRPRISNCAELLILSRR